MMARLFSHSLAAIVRACVRCFERCRAAVQHPNGFAGVVGRWRQRRVISCRREPRGHTVTRRRSEGKAVQSGPDCHWQLDELVMAPLLHCVPATNQSHMWSNFGSLFCWLAGGWQAATWSAWTLAQK